MRGNSVYNGLRELVFDYDAIHDASTKTDQPGACICSATSAGDGSSAST